ncbi:MULTISPECIES: M20 aminoacylase family protein [Roseobacteraceae]|uniref:N-acyl-L-amino acid amidohydrolase n=1 Tax=Pseudosulfitobacter pseudonitzschiae TaxID=1402135 RepID=A0A221JVW4_9RHOB|nr:MULTISPECIES: M20 aminoacylase family protein [Roseobacteraceae]ASM70888.1 N-acyl-L-amino acid amidohydrolase [Pseudosulfitobacter pseudonitzschiae]
MPDITTANLLGDMTAWRHEFHANPELGFAETRTAARVAELLESFGLEVHRGVGHTGVIGVLQRGNGTRAVGLRADMDALPISETTGAAYASRTAGVMHACGHDGHMAMLLGAAKHLAAHGQFNGRVVFIFQPCEEHGQGAQAMITDGLFERFAVDQVFAIHNMPGLATGHLETRVGPMTASEALFEIGIRARGGHAALPHLGVDAIVVGAQIVAALQMIVSRKLDPAQNGVVSITEFIADGGRNVLPGSAILKGDARALSPDTNTMIEARMRELVAGTCNAHDVTGEVGYETIFAPTINDAEAVAAVARAGNVALGAGNVDTACFPKLFSEDFAHMAIARPGCFLLMGNGTKGAHGLPLHASGYDFNDAGLVPGADVWVNLVHDSLAAT